MFNKVIELKSEREISMGTTKVGYQRTIASIMDLLEKHGCQKMGTIKEGNDLRIGFQIDDIPFVIDVPKVYVRDDYKPQIGVRIVFWYLKSMLELVKKRVVPIHNLLLPFIQVRDPEDEKLKPMADLWEKRLSEGKGKPEELLLGE